ncbi:MAG: sulfotransferase [Pseudomonadota bacterium]
MEQELQQLKEAADAAFNAGDYAEAETQYQEILKLTPDSVAAHYAIGTIALQEKSLKKAVEHLANAAELEPDGVDIAFNLATALYMGGNRMGALVQLERAAKHCQDDPVFCSRIAEMSIRLGEADAALTIMSRLSRLTPDHQVIVANAHGLLGNWREATGILSHLNDSVPDNPVIIDKLAVAAGHLGDFKTSVSMFEHYLRLITPTAKDYLRFADLLLLAHDTKRCDQALDLAIEKGADGPEAYVIKARTARLNGDYDAVHAALEKALERQANHGQAWSIRAELADEANLPSLVEQLQQQLDQEEQVAQLNHHHQALLNYAMADMQDRLGDYAGATKALRRANKIQNVAMAMTNVSYNAEATTAQFDEIIANYPSQVFEQADAAIPTEGPQITPIFIVGMVRSGTTLVERILGQNPHVHNAGEQDGMDMVASHYHRQVKNNRAARPEDADAELWGQLRQLYLEKLPEISKPIFTDKLPHNFRQVGLILKLFPEARIIQMHRAQLDVCMSVYSHAFSFGHNYATHWPDMKHFHGEAERIMAHWSGLNSSRVLDINYEDLVREPEDYARKIVEFCGFDWNDSYLDFHQAVNQSFTFSEMQVRKPIADKRIDRWQQYAEHIPEITAD